MPSAYRKSGFSQVSTTPGETATSSRAAARNGSSEASSPPFADEGRKTGDLADALEQVLGRLGDGPLRGGVRGRVGDGGDRPGRRLQDHGDRAVPRRVQPGRSGDQPGGVALVHGFRLGEHQHAGPRRMPVDSVEGAQVDRNRQCGGDFVHRVDEPGNGPGRLDERAAHFTSVQGELKLRAQLVQQRKQSFRFRQRAAIFAGRGKKFGLACEKWPVEAVKVFPDAGKTVQPFPVEACTVRVETEQEMPGQVGIRQKSASRGRPGDGAGAGQEKLREPQ